MLSQRTLIPRTLADVILQNIRDGFISIIYGPRQIGKTVLFEQIRTRLTQGPHLLINGDTEEGRSALGTTSEVKLSALTRQYEVILVDEAQRIPHVGLALKILIDRFPQKRIFATGSSSLDLARGMQEHLTGRNLTFLLYPLSTPELSREFAPHQLPALLESQMIYGGYPHLQHIAPSREREQYLYGIVEDYLFRDVLRLEKIDNPDSLRKLATLLAFQIGHEVSQNELSRALGIDVKTVARYLSLLEKSFVILPIGAYAKNLRNEVSKSKKYYFIDLGIRNALIHQFLPLDHRTDVGALWENFLFLERWKRLHYQRIFAQHYFWRTYQGAEIDMIEEVGPEVRAFEFKWATRTYRRPAQFEDAYQAHVELITKDNYLDFV